MWENPIFTKILVKLFQHDPHPHPHQNSIAIPIPIPVKFERVSYYSDSNQCVRFQLYDKLSKDHNLTCSQ